MRQSSLFFPLLLITVGAAWFLKSTDILPATSTLIAAAFATVGVLVLLMDGINKQSVVAGPLLVYVGVAIPKPPRQRPAAGASQPRIFDEEISKPPAAPVDTAKCAIKIQANCG